MAYPRHEGFTTRRPEQDTARGTNEIQAKVGSIRHGNDRQHDGHNIPMPGAPPAGFKRHDGYVG
jgi:hypothetical protein